MSLYCIVFLIVLFAASGVQGQDVVDITAISFDFNTFLLSLTFSEPVDIDDVSCTNYTGFILQNAVSNPTKQYQLASGDIGGCFQPDDMSVTFRILAYDIVGIDGLFESAATSFLAWDENLFLSTSTQSITAGVMAVTTFLADTTRPRVVSFAIDLNSGTLTLTFDTLVDVSTVDPEALSFFDEDTATRTLPWTPTDVDFTSIITMTLPFQYQGSLARSGICLSINDCYIFFGMDFISDPLGNPVEIIAMESPLQAATLISDTTSPSLVEFAVTLSEGSTSLTLSFSEAVRATTLDPTAISFTTAPGNTNNTVTLTGVYLRVEESQSIEITLSAADSAALAEAGICLAPQTCFIFFNTNTIQDYNENYVVPILLETALLASSVTFREDVTIEASATEVEIEREQTQLVLTCTPSNEELPVVWREGERSLIETISGVSLSDDDLHYTLTLDLTTFSLTGDDIVCQVNDPDDDQVVLASATIEITLPHEQESQCEAEEDTVWSIQWDTTDEGDTNEQDCPRPDEQQQEVIGVARRKCLDGGRWDRVDISECVNKEISDLRIKVDEDLREPNFTQRQMLLSAALPVLEDALTPSKEVFVFPRDLVLSNTIVMDVLLTLAYGVAQEVGIDTLQTSVLRVLDKMLSRNHTESWRQTAAISNQSDGSQLLQNTEDYGKYVAEAIMSDYVDTTDDTVILTLENIELSAQKLNKSEYLDVVYPEDDEEENIKAQIKIPADHLSSRGASAVANMVIENIKDFLPEDDEGVPAALVISSQVIADKNSSSASVPVELIFTTFPMENARNPRCVYWSFMKRRWLQVGVETLTIEDLGSFSYRVRCESSHLTSFSVLVDIDEEESRFELTLAGYVGAGVLTGCALLSSLLYTVSLFASCCCSRQFKSVHVVHLAYLGLSLSILCTGVLFLAGLTEATENMVACTVVAALLQYFFTAAFSWTLVIEFLVLLVVAPSSPVHLSVISALLSLLFGFGLPLIPTAISVSLLHDDYGNTALCWITNDISDMVLWANVAPMAAFALVGLLLVLITLLFTCIRRGNSDFKLSGLLIIQLSTVLLTVFVGGPWASGVVMVNDTWDPAQWLFLASCATLGLISLAVGMVLVCCGSKFYKELKDDTDGNQYWKDIKPLIKEAGQLQTEYEMKGTAVAEQSAYAMMGAPTTEKDMEAMMEGAPPNQETALQGSKACGDGSSGREDWPHGQLVKTRTPPVQK